MEMDLEEQVLLLQPNQVSIELITNQKVSLEPSGIKECIGSSLVKKIELKTCVLYVKPIKNMKDIKSRKLVEVKGRIYLLVGGYKKDEKLIERSTLDNVHRYPPSRMGQDYS